MNAALCSELFMKFCKQEEKEGREDNPRGLLVFLNFKTILGPTSVELIFQTYHTPPMLQISDFGRSD